MINKFDTYQTKWGVIKQLMGQITLWYVQKLAQMRATFLAIADRPWNDSTPAVGEFWSGHFTRVGEFLLKKHRPSVVPTLTLPIPQQAGNRWLPTVALQDLQGRGRPVPSALPFCSQKPTALNLLEATRGHLSPLMLMAGVATPATQRECRTVEIYLKVQALVSAILLMRCFP